MDEELETEEQQQLTTVQRDREREQAGKMRFRVEKDG